METRKVITFDKKITALSNNSRGLKQLPLLAVIL
jgi:hypothetical protein